MADKEMKLEESFDRIEHIIKEMERAEVSLEDSFHLYQEGMKLLKVCNDSIDKVEKQLVMLNENGESNEL